MHSTERAHRSHTGITDLTLPCYIRRVCGRDSTHHRSLAKAPQLARRPPRTDVPTQLPLNRFPTQLRPSSTESDAMPTKRTRPNRSKDARKGRRRVAPPTRGWLKPELAALLLLSPATITKYVVTGLLPRTTFRGVATRYQREHLIRLLAIREMRAQGIVSLARIKVLLSGATAEQLERWVLSVPQTEAVMDALANDAASDTTAARHAGTLQDPREQLPNPVIGHASSLTTTGAAAAGECASALEEPWQFVHLTSNLVLSWRTDANDANQQVVRKLIGAVRNALEANQS
jgi:DNA-binding transcriptional MerR regulator